MSHVPVERPTLQELIRSEKWADAVSMLEQMHPSDASAMLSQLSERNQRSLFKMLFPAAAAAILPHLLCYDQYVLLMLRPREEMLDIMNGMAPDDRMRLLDELPDSAWQKLVGELAATERGITERFSKYAPNQAGRYVTPEYIYLSPGMKASQALAAIRLYGRGKETLNLVYVVGPDGNAEG